MQDVINEFTDYLRDEFRKYQQWSQNATAKGEYDKRSRYDFLRDQAWENLYRYRETVLKLRRYSDQRTYANKILRELNGPGVAYKDRRQKIRPSRTAKKRHKSTPHPLLPT